MNKFISRSFTEFEREYNMLAKAGAYETRAEQSEADLILARAQEADDNLTLDSTVEDIEAVARIYQQAFIAGARHADANWLRLLWIVHMHYYESDSSPGFLPFVHQACAEFLLHEIKGHDGELYDYYKAIELIYPVAYIPGDSEEELFERGEKMMAQLYANGNRFARMYYTNVERYGE